MRRKERLQMEQDDHAELVHRRRSLMNSRKLEVVL